EEHGWQSTHTVVEIVNDDMPFLVDSVTMEVNRHASTLHLILHPILAVQRGADGALAGLAASDTKGAKRESFIHVEIDRMTSAAAGSQSLCAPSGAARRHQIDVAIDRASARLPRLHRGQALQCQWRGVR